VGNFLEGRSPHFLNATPVDPAELKKLRVMSQCTSRYFISFGLAKKSPYTAPFNEAMVRLIEAGIIQYWREDITSRHVSPIDMKLLAEDAKENTEPQALRLENVQGSFLILGTGLFLASTAFIIEISAKFISSKRNKTRRSPSSFY
jgi:hypothetical protein